MKRFGIKLAAWSSAMLLPLPVWAEEGKTSLPQLDASRFPEQLFWLAICFPLFFLMMRFMAVPKVQQVQGSRRQLLDADLAAAKAASQQAEATVVGYEKALAEAHAEAQSTVEAILAEASKEAERQEAAQRQSLQTRMAEAEGKVDAARRAALADAPKMVSDVVASLTDKVTKTALVRG